MHVVWFVITAVLARLPSAGAAVVFPILAVHELHDITAGALLVAASLAPSVVAAPIVGALLDSTRRPRAMLFGACIVSGLGYASGALLGSGPLPLILIAVLAAGCATPFVMGGLSSFVTTIVEPEHTAYASDTLAYSVAGVLGPALCAMIIAVATPRTAILVLAGAAILGAAGLLALRLVPHGHGRDAGLWRRVAAGLRHLVAHRPLLLVTASSTLTQVGAGAFPIAAVALAIQRWGDAETGAWIVTAFSVGSLVSALAVTVLPLRRYSAALVMGVGFAATGALTAVAGLAASLPVVLIAVAAAGLFSAPSTAAMFELRTVNSPPSVRAQVFTVGAGLRAAAGALGAALIGPVAGLDAGILVVFVGLAWIASAAIMLPYRSAGAAAVSGA